MKNKEIKTQVLVLGAGPAGYSAAFRCSDLGLKTLIVEKYDTLGGVCLNVGCIPSKTLLHISKVFEEIKKLQKLDVFSKIPSINLEKIVPFKTKKIDYLTKNLSIMAKKRNINIINGLGKFSNNESLTINSNNSLTTIFFDYAIIATGSKPVKCPFLDSNIKNSRIWDSTDALNVPLIPKRMLVLGGGIIGLEMSTIYQTFGTNIDIVETTDQIIPIIDRDVAIFFKKVFEKKVNFMLETKISSLEIKENGIDVCIQKKNGVIENKFYDVILSAIGRSPNTKNIGLEKIDVNINSEGFIIVDKQMKTTNDNIYAVGDVTGQPMLAHKGVHEGHIAAEVIAGKKHYFDPKVIPSIAYTEPEIGWVGITEKVAKQEKINYKTAIFPWKASGRAIASCCETGITKLIFDKDNHRVIGGSVVGTNGGELLGEISLAIEMGCYAEDLALTIHAHPTLYESIGLTAEIFEGTITDLLNVKNKDIN